MNTVDINSLCIELLSGDPTNQYFQLVLVSLGLVALIASVWWQVDTAANEEQTHKLQIESFDSLDLTGTLNVLVTAGNEPFLSIRGDKQAVSSLKVRQYGTTLKLSNRFWFWFWYQHRPVFVTVTTPTLRQVEITGASVVQFKGFKNIAALELEITGASNVTFEGDVEHLSAEITGASKVNLHGLGKQLTAEITGASVLQAFGYTVETASLELSGACTAKIAASKRIKAELAGASKLQYQGEPVLHVETAGASSISQA